MNSTMVPNMTISSSGVSVKCRGQIKMFANTHSGQMPFLVTLNAVSKILFRTLKLLTIKLLNICTPENCCNNSKF